MSTDANPSDEAPAEGFFRVTPPTCQGAETEIIPEKHGRGRPPREPTAETPRQVQEMARIFVSQKSIATIIGTGFAGRGPSPRHGLGPARPGRGSRRRKAR